MRIEICGGIAAGKTSLASLLQEENIGTVLYEDFHSNPFWKAFYANPGEYIFETELTFTLQHYHEIKKQKNANLVICDYSLLLDLAYANIGLTERKLEIYHQTLKEIYNDISQPDLYIYLECSENEELRRIRKRNRAVESNIELDFLLQLNDELLLYIDRLSQVNILKINSEQYDFVNSSMDKEKVLSMVGEKVDQL